MTPNSSENQKSSWRLELVVKRSDWWVGWDPRLGGYWLYDEEMPPLAPFDPPEPAQKIWKPEFERRVGFYDGREGPMLLAKIDREYFDPVAGKNRKWRHHLIRDGKALCPVSDPAVTPDDTDQLVPVTDLSEREIEKLRYGNLCGTCVRYLDSE